MTNPTQPQAAEAREDSRRMSMAAARPPTDVPGYEPQRLLGTGAYGEVWVALDKTTGRRVAIKFYTHRGGLDWSLLAREVEKLAFLSADRYIVQLLDVGWDATPPYFVMEFIEAGSLENRLQTQGVFPADDAVAMFREIALGLLHAHAKGVLHCDLKPANVLLDDDGWPRLADFGQSRLSHEQAPALGTLFYMAPEQADLKAAPDARWDVYALGAVLYAMLTGKPPHQDEAFTAELLSATSLDERLAWYRDGIARRPAPDGHRKISGVDRDLADLLDRMLQADPRRRLPNVQAVLDGLAARDQRRARRPLVVLGALGPALILIVAALFGWLGFRSVLRQSDRSLTAGALEGNEFAARFVARAAADELNRRFRAVEQAAADPALRRLLAEVEADPQLKPLLTKLNDPSLADDSAEQQDREAFLANPLIRRLQEMITGIRQSLDQPPSASWFVTDAQGLQLARDPMSRTVGRNFAWRTYFAGALEDRSRDWRPSAEDGPITKTHLSAVFRSRASRHWIVTISTPIRAIEAPHAFLGVLALTVDVGGFVELRGDEDPNQFAVLVDLRDGPDRGLILQHPFYDDVIEEDKVPRPQRLGDDALPTSDPRRRDYADPIAADPAGGRFARHWLAAMAPVMVRQQRAEEPQATGWQVIVQQSYEEAIGGPLENLRQRLILWGLLAFALAAVVITLLWALVLWGINRGRRVTALGGGSNSLSGSPSAATLPDMAAIQRNRGKINDE